MATASKTLIDSTKGLKFTESPRWYNDRLWFIDIHDKRIKTVDLSGSVATILELPFIPNAFGLTSEGTVVVGDAFQRRIHRMEGTVLTQVADISDLTNFCLSDGIVDAQGRLYVGDIGYNFVDQAVERPSSPITSIPEWHGDHTGRSNAHRWRDARPSPDGLRYTSGRLSQRPSRLGAAALVR